MIIIFCCLFSEIFPLNGVNLFKFVNTTYKQVRTEELHLFFENNVFHCHFYHRYSLLLCIIYLRHLKLLLVLINFVTFIICFLGWWRIQYLSLLILSFRFTIFFIIYQFMKRQTILSFTCNLSCRISKAYYDRRTQLLWNCKVT